MCIDRLLEHLCLLSVTYMTCAYVKRVKVAGFLHHGVVDFLLIHSADSQSWPVVIIVHCFHTCSPTCVRPHFSKSSKTKQIQVKTMFTTGKTVGLAEWIIDDTCLVYHSFLSGNCNVGINNLRDFLLSFPGFLDSFLYWMLSRLILNRLLLHMHMQ